MRVSPLDMTHSLFTCSVLNVLPVKRTSCVLVLFLCILFNNLLLCGYFYLIDAFFSVIVVRSYSIRKLLGKYE